MPSRIPLVYIDGTVQELPSTDTVSGAVQPVSSPSPTLATLLPGELRIDSLTGQLVIRIGDLVYRFDSANIISFVGKLDFSLARNSHWIGVMA